METTWLYQAPTITLWSMLIHIWPTAGDNANKIWKFEYLSDDTGEELPASFQEQANRLTQDLRIQIQQSTQKDERIASLERELADQRRDAEENGRALTKLMVGLAQKDRELAGKDEVIRQLQQDLQDKEEALSRASKENEEMLHLRKQQVQLEGDLSQQKAETASLQGKMDRVEYLMARMSRSYEQT
ncbi:hypothetical protein FRC07_001365 [Ceratobasidium sp. 392]|nr:hypothetical protein FRC07_001365 [Ceratobasidium sp. 392]